MLTIQVEVDSRRLGGSSLLVPFKDAWLASHTCRELLHQVLNQNSDRSDALVTADQITLFCSKKLDCVTGFGLCRSSLASANQNLDRSDALVTVEQISFFCSKKLDCVT